VLVLFAVLCTIGAVAVCALYAYAMSQSVSLVVHCCKAKKRAGGDIMILTDSPHGQAAYGASIARLFMAMNDFFDVS